MSTISQWNWRKKASETCGFSPASGSTASYRLFLFDFLKQNARQGFPWYNLRNDNCLEDYTFSHWLHFYEGKDYGLVIFAFLVLNKETGLKKLKKYISTENIYKIPFYSIYCYLTIPIRSYRMYKIAESIMY